MDKLPQETLSLPIVLVMLSALAASLAVWAMVGARTLRGMAVLPYEGRRRVPWRATEVAVVLGVYALPIMISLVFAAAAAPVEKTPEHELPGARIAGSMETPDAEKPDGDHGVVELLRADFSARTFLLCILVAAVVAPIVEEFLFRLLLQGWLEAVELRLRRPGSELRRLVPGLAPVLLTSVLFAAMHVRLPAEPKDPEELIHNLAGGALVGLLTLVFAVCLLRFRAGATLEDLGLIAGKLFSDVRLGILLFAALTAPIYLMLYGLVLFVLPEGVVADPIPLFFFALALGIVYYRTHRIVPVIVAHMAFNAYALSMAWLMLSK